ncbi:MAG TPA: trigger factor [bacterium]|nr:trigger factor [bacterium]
MKLVANKKIDEKKGEICFEINIPYEEIEQFLEKTAKKINKDLKIDGFRAGKIPFDVVKKQVGEMYLLQSSMEDIVDTALNQILKENDLRLFITPKIEMDKLAPNNPIEFKATIHQLPTFTLKAWDKIKIKSEEIKVEDKEIDESMKGLLEYLVKEKEILRPIANGNVAILNFDVAVDNVPLEGGSAKDYHLVVGQQSMIPGFEEALIGLSAGEEKIFNLNFPKDYPHKPIAGKAAEFKVKINKVMEREYPEVNDDLAKELKYESLAELKESMKKNLLGEKAKNADIQNMNQVFDELLKKADFDHINDAFIDQETRVMLNELKQNIEKQRGNYEHYLEHIKKTEEDLLKEMRPEAEKRVKISLILKEIVDKNNLSVTEEDIDKQFAQYGEASEEMKTNKRFRHYIEQNLLNKKTIEFIKETLGLK